MSYDTTSVDTIARPKRPYHPPTIERIGSIAEVTAGDPTVGPDDDSNYGPNTTGS